MSDEPDVDELLKAARAGDRDAIDRIFDQHRLRLRRMVEIRLNRRLWGRIDPSDIVQETLLQASRNLDGYLESPQISAYLWLRTLAHQQILVAHRQHLGTAKRDAELEIASLDGGASASSESMALVAIADQTSPSEAVARDEQVRRLQEAIEGMEPMDREILALRHFEQLSNSEVAGLLKIGTTAASQRFFRALSRLRLRLMQLGLMDESK